VKDIVGSSPSGYHCLSQNSPPPLFQVENYLIIVVSTGYETQEHS